MPPQKKKPTTKKTTSRTSSGSRTTASSPKQTSDDASKRGNYAVSKRAQIRSGVMGLITLALSIWLFVALAMESAGWLGDGLNWLLRGLFSNAAYVLPIMFMWIGISSFLAPTIRTSHKYWLALASVVFVSMVIHLLDQEFSLTVSELWARGQQIRHYNEYGVYIETFRSFHGGVVGGLIGNALVGSISAFGAWVVAITGIIVTFVLVTGISIQIIFAKFGEKIKLWRAKAKESRYIAEQERLELLHEMEHEKELKQLEVEEAQPPEENPRIIIPSSNVSERYGKVDPNKEYFDDYFKKGDTDVETDKPSEKQPKRNISLSIDNIQEANVANLLNISNTNEFEPPSLSQMKENSELLNADVREALGNGVPIDEAVTRAKNATIQENEQLSMIPAYENAPIPNYKSPPLSLLSKPQPRKQTAAQLKKELNGKAEKLLATLASFGVEATIETVVQGPTVTRFEVTPGSGVKVNKITNLSDDIALALAATGIIIAPIAGKSAIGIEIPNEVPETVSVKEVIDTEEFENFRSKTAFALGKDIAGNIVIADIAKMPHLLVAGATGSGKSVCINSLVTSILYKAKPNEVKMIMIDPKMVELTIYNGIPHLFLPVITDSKKASSALNWAVIEMENRYKLFETNKCRNLTSYNELAERKGDETSKLPEIIIIIDELADLMMVARAEVESSISRLAAKARAAGMYLVIATQRPSVDVITGVIKANVPSRISFAVSSHIDSRTIIDTQGAEKLLGRGDMLYYPYGASKPMRIQGNFVSDADVENVVEYVKKQNIMQYNEEIIQQIDNINETQHCEDEEDNPGNADELLPKAIEMAIELNQASVAMLQRRFKIGYQRAARIIDQMEEREIVGPYEGTKPRQVLISKEDFLEMSGSNGWT